MRQIIISCIALLFVLVTTSANLPLGNSNDINAEETLLIKIQVNSNGTSINSSKENKNFTWKEAAGQFADCNKIRTHLKTRTGELKEEWLAKEVANHPNAKITSASDDYSTSSCSAKVTTITINIKW